MRTHRGFSFAEVMFAVAILGVGFMMICAIFPVAIAQTSSTADQAVAAALARDAISIIRSSVQQTDFPLVTDNSNLTRPFADVTSLWNQVAGSTIDPTDARYAWVPYFSPGTISGSQRITVVVVRRYIHDRYTPADLSAEGALAPRGVTINSIVIRPDGSQLVSIQRDINNDYQCVAPGAFLIIRSDQNGSLGGRVFRLGQFESSSNDSVVYSLDRAEGLSSGESCDTAQAAVIGRDFKDPANPRAGFDGPAQDIAVYTTYICPK